MLPCHTHLLRGQFWILKREACLYFGCLQFAVAAAGCIADRRDFQYFQEFRHERLRYCSSNFNHLSVAVCKCHSIDLSVNLVTDVRPHTPCRTTENRKWK